MQEKRTLFEILTELGDCLDESSENRRECVLLAIGYVLGAAYRAGWTVAELVALRAWPAKYPPLVCECTEWEMVGHASAAYGPSWLDGSGEVREHHPDCPKR